MGTGAIAGVETNPNGHKHHTGISKSYLSGESRYPPEPQRLNSDGNNDSSEEQDSDIEPTYTPPTNNHTCTNTNNRQKPPKEYQRQSQEARDKINLQEEKDRKADEQRAKDMKRLRKELINRQRSSFIRHATKYNELENNMLFERVGLGVEHISSSSEAPPEWASNHFAGVISGLDANDNITYKMMPEPEDNLIYRI